MEMWMGVRRLAFGGLIIAGVSGCEDKAKPSYDECMQAKAKEDWSSAVSACEKATTLDPKSKSGAAATNELPTLREKLAAKKKADDEAAAAKAKAEADARAKQEAEDAKCTDWATICTIGRFPDGSEQTSGLQHFKTKADCQGIGAKMGGIPCDPCRCWK